MGFGGGSGDEAGDRRERQPFTGCLRFTGNLERGRRQCRRQHQATDAAIFGADLAVILSTGWRRLSGEIGVTNNANWSGCGVAGGAGGYVGRKQAGERNRISGDQRHSAPP